MGGAGRGRGAVCGARGVVPRSPSHRTSANAGWCIWLDFSRLWAVSPGFLHYGPLHRVAALLLCRRRWGSGSPDVESEPHHGRSTLVRRTMPVLLGLVILVAGVQAGAHWWQRRQGRSR
mgnify:CR=1 FL=1